jgi:hypothetical protein
MNRLHGKENSEMYRNVCVCAHIYMKAQNHSHYIIIYNNSMVKYQYDVAN